MSVRRHLTIFAAPLALVFSMLQAEMASADVIKLMNSDGSDSQTVLRTTGIDGLRWTPDGGMLSFQNFGPGKGTDSSIYLVNLDGSGRRRILNVPKTLYEYSWSPDGSRIVYTRGPMTAAEIRAGFESPIFAIGVDGTQKRRITNIRTRANSLSWSKPRDSIAFDACTASYDRCYAYTVSAQGNEKPRRLSIKTRDGSSSLEWSPVNSDMAATAPWRRVSSSFETSPLKKFSLESGGPGTFVSKKRDAVATFSWSPDGQQIAYTAFLRTSDFSQLYLVNTDGSARRKIGRPSCINDVAWSPDGTRLAASFTDLNCSKGF